MRSIAIINQKGGVGKTTTAVNLSAALATLGRRVWLIDMDPQAHASLHLGVVADRGQSTVYDVLTGQAELAAARYTIADNLWLTPSHLDLAATELELAGEVGRETILRDKLKDSISDLDYLIIDCPPSLGILTLNSLTSADEVFLPMQPHFLALHGLSKLLHTVELVTRRLNPTLRASGVMFCMCDNQTRLANEVIGDVHEFFARPQGASPWQSIRCFESRIRRNVRLAEAPSFGRSIFEYAPGSHGAEDYRRLADEVLAMESIQVATTNREMSTRAA